MKKLIALCLALLMLVSVSACLKKDDNKDMTDTDDTVVISPDTGDNTDDVTPQIITDNADDEPSDELAEDETLAENNTDQSSSTSQDKPEEPKIPDDETEEEEEEEIFISDEIYFSEYFKPVIRFIVASDVHFDDTGSENQEARLKRMFEVAYEYSDSQEYSALDGAFIAGDFTNRGTETSMRKFFEALSSHAKDETITHATLGNHEYGAGDATKERYLRLSGYTDIHEHMIIGGYHFLFLSPDTNSGYNFSEEAREWLAEHLEVAAMDDESGEKPIFVFQHEHIKGTVYGSENWGVSDLTDILEKYPQVIDFSGHSHYPMNDPRSIWQGSFTALGTSTLSYYEMGIAGVHTSGIFHSDNEGGYSYSAQKFDAAQFYIVEVDANNAVKIIGYDITAGKFMDDVVYNLRSVKSTDEFIYTDERKENSEIPYFTEDTSVNTENITSTSAKIIFGQALCEDDVQNYIVELYKEDTLISSQRRLACTFMDPAPEDIAAYFESLDPESTYTVKITAVSSWEKTSAPLTFEFTTEPLE